MEEDIIPMCEDQGMGIVPWAALGAGQLLSAEQRRAQEQNPDSRKGTSSKEISAVCDTLESLAQRKNTTLQAIVGLSLIWPTSAVC